MPVMMKLSLPRLILSVIFLHVFSLLWAQPNLRLDVNSTPNIRVLLKETSEANIRLPAAHRGYVDDILRFSAASALRWRASARGNQLLVDGQVIGESLTLEPIGNAFLEWQGEQYRGVVRLLARDSKVQIINIVPVESYLRGVVPSEMQALWPAEALKAQAVAARTYSLVNLNPQASYDICATDECQEYHGVQAEHPNSDAAIRATTGLVLSYAGQLARTYYHADSGGRSATAAEVWGMSSLPYLVAQQDYVQDSPHSNWTVEVNPSVAAALLRRYGYDVGVVQAMQVTSVSDSGRANQMRFTGEKGVASLAGQQLNQFLRDLGLKSTLIRSNGLQVIGQGWGHGVGMSQYGARTLAAFDYSYQQILNFYYPQTVLQALAP